MPEVIRVLPRRNDSDYYEREEYRVPVRTRERERVYEEVETYRRGSRPEFLRDDYGRSDRAPLVVRQRTLDRSGRSPSPIRIQERIVGRERSPSPLQVGKARTSIIVGPEREETVYEARRGRDSSPTGAVRRERPPSVERVVITTRTTHYREVDEVIWDLSRTKDVTLHLELDITEDLEPDLDEFCHLSRLGNFHQAKQYFRENLEEHIEDPYVFVQYAQMLMEMGDYQSAKALSVPYSLEESGNQLLQTNWKLIQSLCSLHTERLSDDHLQQAALQAAEEVVSLLPARSDDVEGATKDWEIVDVPPGTKHVRMGNVEVGSPEITWQRYDGVRRSKLNPEREISESGRPGTTFQEAKPNLAQLRAKKDEATLKDDVSAAADLLYYGRYESLEKHKPAADADEKSPLRPAEARTITEEKANLGSTECQMLNLSLRILAHLTHVPQIVRVEALDWKMFYENLLREGRVWDFKDIFTGAILYYGQERACDEIFESSETPLNRIIQDWSTAIYDESTNIALLDTLVSLVLAQHPTPRTIAGMRRLIDEASNLASSIVQNNPGNLKSRQYIRWILAKVTVTSYRDIFSSSPSVDLPGLFLDQVVALDLPIYVPEASENPDWQLLCLRSKSSDTLQMVLKAARELGDLETEVMCLKQLIFHREDPTEFFDKLIHLQKTAQHDIDGWLRTSLSKYIICRDEKSRDGLREEILSVSDYANFDANLAWARNMILRALARSEHEATLALDEARNSLEGLSANIGDYMVRHKLLKADVSQVKPQPADKQPKVGETPDENLSKEYPKDVASRGDRERFTVERDPARSGAKKTSPPGILRTKAPATSIPGKTSTERGAESPKQKLSEIYVTLDEDAPEPEAVKPTAYKDARKSRVEDEPDRKSKSLFFEAVVGALAGNRRRINTSRSAVEENGDSNQGGRSRTRFRDLTAGDIGEGLAAAATAGLSALSETKLLDRSSSRSRSRSRERERRRRDSADSYYTRSPSPTSDRRRKRSANVTEYARRGLAALGIGELAGAGRSGENVRDRDKDDRRSRRKYRDEDHSSSPPRASADPELGLVVYGTEPVYTHDSRNTLASTTAGDKDNKLNRRRTYIDEDYSPSPPHASGGSYYPENNQFPPPPLHIINTKAASPIPPYNPSDYVSQQPPNLDPYGYPPPPGTENTGATKRVRSSPVSKVAPAGAAGAAKDTNPKETEPEVSHNRRPPAVSVSSATEDVE